MLLLQDTKTKIIQQALGKEGNNKQLTTTDLIRLFGHKAPRLDDQGDVLPNEEEFIVVEDELDEADPETEMAKVPDREPR